MAVILSVNIRGSSLLDIIGEHFPMKGGLILLCYYNTMPNANTFLEEGGSLDKFGALTNRIGAILATNYSDHIQKLSTIVTPHITESQTHYLLSAGVPARSQSNHAPTYTYIHLTSRLVDFH